MEGGRVGELIVCCGGPKLMGIVIEGILIGCGLFDIAICC